jgi:hypothetical protein
VRNHPVAVRKVVLEQAPAPATTASDLVATNVAAVLGGTALVLLHIAVLAFVFTFAFVAGMLKAANRRGRSW